MIFAKENGRKMPKEDKIFAISGRAKKMIAEKGEEQVINATIGALLDDKGKLVILSSVLDAIKTLTPEEYAEYAPIGGTADFKEATKKATFGNYIPKGLVEVCATPGGTGAIRNTVANYSEPGDKVLTSDWFWAPYKTICQEIGRDLDTYQLFNGDGKFNIVDFDKKVNHLLESQDQLVILLNTPAHNPTGYSLTDEDWDGVKASLEKATKRDKKVILFVDAAYIDFAGDEEEYRSFLPKLEELSDNVLPIIGYSGSKTLTLYGMRCGAMLCISSNKEVIAEFKQVTEFSSRGSWSNSTRASQAVMAKIYNDNDLMKKVGEERKAYRDMLIARGKTFEKTLRDEGITNVPFDAGFFACIDSDRPDEISGELEKLGIFTVPLAKGVRVSVASISEEKCIKTAKAIAKVMK